MKKRLSLSLLLAAALPVISSGCSVGDQLCPEGTDHNEDGDSCPYGPPGGPKGKLADCVVTLISGPECETTTWRDTIYPLFNNGDILTSGCTEGGSCHGAATLPLMPKNDEATTYTNLKGFTGSVGSPYINGDDVSTSWIVCNLRNEVGVGMPQLTKKMQPQDALLVETWVACGAKQNGIGGGQGAGGGGAGGGGAGGGGGGI